ncbi:hypothetical protein D8674_004157 [Pyrus ussuriensis x Pyrus communis]|uniref:Uncharacterized protein n=1 Tax=Pyrus ussuriensis x Pyrus communis TaxID=2448454 RepID=A0A5N5FPH2_9ROSA|nr:hypothetical protein D8674_004157 [Pyrus ussuriensis x Pyrus communis]
MVESIVLDHAFWTQSEHVCQVFEPLYKVLRIVDTEVYPTIGAIYELMRAVKEDLERKHGARWVIKIIDDRWYKTLYHDLHAADARRTFGEPTSVAARTKMSPNDDEGNPALRVAEKAHNEGIIVERVLEEEVGSSNADSLEEILRLRPRNTGIPPSSNPTQPQNPADTNDSSITRSSDSLTTGGGNDEGYSGAGGGGGYGNYVEPPPGFMSPFTGEANFTHATQDEDHGSRWVGPGIGVIGKDYTRRERGKGTLSSQEDDSLSITSDSLGVGSSDYGYTHNQPFSYPSYPIHVGMESSNSWKESETQSSNDFSYGQHQLISDPYGWHGRARINFLVVYLRSEVGDEALFSSAPLHFLNFFFFFPLHSFITEQTVAAKQLEAK